MQITEARQQDQADSPQMRSGWWLVPSCVAGAAIWWMIIVALVG